MDERTLILALAFAGMLLVFALLFRRSGRSRYEDYLRSSRWKSLRNEALDRDGRRCRLCNRAGRLQVHHRTYPAVWGRETVEDLTTLCDDCHALVSKSEAQIRIYGR